MEAVRLSVKAVIDVGSNSIKLLVAELNDGKENVIEDRLEVTRLGEGVRKSGFLSEQAMKRTAAAIEGMKKECDELGVSEIIAVGTAALRSASNSIDFTKMVHDDCGVDLKVIDGEKEAEYSFRAASGLLGGVASGKNLCMLDVGGGSSEVVFGGTSGITALESVAVGALSLYDKFFSLCEGPYDALTISGASVFVRSLLEEARVSGVMDGVSAAAVGVGGTVTTMASVAFALNEYNAAKISGSILTKEEIARQIDLYASLDLAGRRTVAGMPAQRAEIILPGACILGGLMDCYGFDSITVSDRGLRYGVMDELVR